MRLTFKWILFATLWLTGGLSSHAVVYSVPEDTNPIWRNPGKGWVSYGTTFPTWLAATPQAKVNLIYNRFRWAEIQPSENTFNWSLIDNAIASATNHDVQFAFGVMNVWQNAVPQWVWNAGAKYYLVSGEKIPYWSPTNTVFFAKMNALIAALGTRYNGNPGIAFLDIRNYGNWGEGHLGFINTADNGERITDVSVSELESYYHQPYLNAFPNTQLVVPYGHVGHLAAYGWDVQHGMGMRRDGIPDWNDGSDITMASGHGPGIIEYTADYATLVAQGIWSDSVVSADILRARASYSEIGRGSESTFLNKTNFLTNLQNKMGYHFVLTNVTVPAALYSAAQNAITLNWVNRGITYLYQPCLVAVALLNTTNDVPVGKAWLPGVKPQRNWAPGPIVVSSTLDFSAVPAGAYKLAIGLFTRTNLTNPDYQLGNLNRTAHGWYVITTNISLLNAGDNAITSLCLSNGAAATINAYGVPHSTYVLQRTTNLAPAAWSNVSTTSAPSEGLFKLEDDYRDLGSNQPPAGFYRLRQMP